MAIKRSRTLGGDANQFFKMAAGIRKFYANKGEVLVRGEWVKPSVLADEAEQHGNDLANLERLAMELTEETRRVKSLEPARREVRQRVDALATMASGGVDPTADVLSPEYLNDPNRPPMMQDFGLVDRKKPTPKTAEELIPIIAKRNATRAILGTKGKRQKERALKEHKEATIAAEYKAAQAAQPAAQSAPETSTPKT
jgi:hypothetical protein